MDNGIKIEKYAKYVRMAWIELYCFSDKEYLQNDDIGTLEQELEDLKAVFEIRKLNENKAKNE